MWKSILKRMCKNDMLGKLITVLILYAEGVQLERGNSGN